jgi:hypothetical protein
MNREQIIKLAREAGLNMYPDWLDGALPDSVERFAALVAAHEREECAKVCESKRDLKEEVNAAIRVANALENGDDDDMIRALRHESNVRLYNAGIDNCAASIRSRKA